MVSHSSLFAQCMLESFLFIPSEIMGPYGQCADYSTGSYFVLYPHCCAEKDIHIEDPHERFI